MKCSYCFEADNDVGLDKARDQNLQGQGQGQKMVLRPRPNTLVGDKVNQKDDWDDADRVGKLITEMR